ncbi:hypothetical protein BGZ94_010291 [Podila epigama]|nr:hypothetical protein BGZ94_010291 [Podila epigama]
MGIQGWNALMARADIQGKLLNSPRSQSKHVHLDLMGTYYFLIRCLYMATPHRDARLVTNHIHRKLAAAFSIQGTTIHLDGRPSVEKAAEHLHRHRLKEHALRRATTLVEQYEAAVHNMSPTLADLPTPTEILERLDDCRSVPKVIGERILTNLEKKGWRVCFCQGEADICIARQPSVETCAVVSADSDMFLHRRIQEVIRPNPANKKQFLVYQRPHVLQRLGFSTEAQLMVLAVVSRSDYTRNNARGYGLVKNYKLIRSLTPLLPTSAQAVRRRQQQSSTERLLQESESILDQYFEQVDVDEERFEHAINVFWHLQDTLLPRRRSKFLRRSFNADAMALTARLAHAEARLMAAQLAAEIELAASMAR